MKKVLILLLIVLIVFQTGCSGEIPWKYGESSYSEKGLSIVDKGNYYDVFIDYTTGVTNRQMGEALGRGILKVIPDYEAIVDSYIAESVNKSVYFISLNSTNDIRKQLDPQYDEEISGLASVIASTDESIFNDGKLSKDEMMLFNLFPDAVRGTQCSVVSVFGKRSETKSTITGRNLDWIAGDKNQLPFIQCVYTIKKPDNQICSIGYLGFMGIITGFSDDKIFAAIIDSPSGSAFTSEGRRSYPMDIRQALETKSSLNDVIDYMKDDKKHYTFNHNIAFSDPEKSVILENNFSGTGNTDKRVNRSVREAGSKLNDGISWGFEDAIGCVNSFVLEGNYNNHTRNKYNTKRWTTMKSQLESKGDTVSQDELRDIMIFDKGSVGNFSESGYLYNKMTLHIVLFQPKELSMEVFFHPRNTTKSPDKPTFEKIEVFKR